jgi:aspartyl/asparaginyl beta-hydroxylase (cupin superfamily)
MNKAIRKFIMRFGGRFRIKLDRFLVRYSKVGNSPVLDNSCFPWTQDIESNWEKIRDEALAVMKEPDTIPPLREISPDHAGIARDNGWKSFFIWGYGYKHPENALSCPETTRIVERIPGLVSAFYSIHVPGLHIPVHRGVTKGIVNCHLALKIPQEREKCWMMLDGTDYPWTDGKALMFDDTYEHAVWNNSNENRIILLIQVLRPMRFPGSLVARFFYFLIQLSPFVQDGRKNIATWKPKKDKDAKEG